MNKIAFAFTCLLFVIPGMGHAQFVTTTLTGNDSHIIVKGTSDTTISGNSVTGLEFFLRWPKQLGDSIFNNLQFGIPGLTLAPQSVMDDFEEPVTHNIQWFVYADPTGVDFDVMQGQEFTILEMDVTYPDDSALIELSSSQTFQSYMVWFYGNPFADLTPPFGTQFYGDLWRISGLFEYEGVQLSKVVSTIDGSLDKVATTIIVFPNPASEVLTFAKNPNTQIEEFTVELINMSGVSVKTQQCHSSFSGSQMSVKDLPGGMYMVKLSTGGRVFANQKIVISR